MISWKANEKQIVEEWLTSLNEKLRETDIEIDMVKQEKGGNFMAIHRRLESLLNASENLLEGRGDSLWLFGLRVFHGIDIEVKPVKDEELRQRLESAIKRVRESCAKLHGHPCPF